MKPYNFSLAKPPEGEADQCTLESARKRQERLDADKEAFFKAGGKVTKLKSYEPEKHAMKARQYFDYAF